MRTPNADKLKCTEMVEKYHLTRNEASYILHTYGSKSGATYYITRDEWASNKDKMIKEARRYLSDYGWRKRGTL